MVKVEKVAPEVVYKLELTTQEYNDIKRVLYWSRSDSDYSATEQGRYEEIYKMLNSNA